MENREVGKHGFSGSWSPDNRPTGIMCVHNLTFSLGIFEWLPKSGGKGVKKGPVKVRVSGPVSKDGWIRLKATEIAALLDKGEYTGPKNVKVK